MKHKLRVTTIGLLVLVILWTGLLTTYTPPYKFRANQVTDWSSQWLYKGNYYTLQGQHLNISPNQAYTISKSLPLNNLSHKYLLFRGSLSDIKVELEGKTIYKSERDNFMWTKTPPASLWHLVPLYNSYVGKKITITYQSPYKSMSGLMNPVFIGYQGDLLFNIITQYGKAFVIDVFILVFGILLLLFAFVNPRVLNTSIWYVGLFSVLVAIWLISESKMLQFFIGHQWINASLAYLTLAIIPIPLLGYIASITSRHNMSLFKKLMRLSLFTLLAVLGLQLLHIADFYETLVLTHTVIVIDIISMSIMLLKELKTYQTQSAVNFVRSLLVLFAFILTEIFHFLFFEVINVTFYVRIGLAIFIIMISYDAIRQLLFQMEKSCKASFFEELAYKDPLTGGKNRLAFDRHMEDLFHDKTALDGLQLLILDMNNLKIINDTYGHVTGDEAIKATYDIIHSIFKDFGNSYRIGGDEFAVIIEQAQEEVVNKSYDALHKAIKAYNCTVDYSFGVAYGSVLYDSSIDETAKKMFHRADNTMYFEKKMRYKTKRI